MPSVKKRKRDEGSSSLSFELAPTSTAPLLVSFPALQAPKDTPFKCYGRKKQKKEKDNDGEEYGRTLVVGESPAVEFISNDEESRRAADSGCRYLLAVHNPRTSKVTLLPTASTPFILTRTVKALKSLPNDDAPAALAYREARTALGETFGTKKAKAAIRAQERNRVDVSAMKDTMEHVVEGIQENAGGLLSKEEAKDLADSSRLVPPFSSTATEPSDVYPLNETIPDPEIKALNITHIEQSLKTNNRTGMLPWRHSGWVNAHLLKMSREEEKSKKRKQKLRILLYVSSMFLFRRVVSHPKGIEKDEVYEKMNNVPPIIVDGLLGRFTEVTRGSSVHQLTSTMSTKFMAYLLALCLRVDDFASNPKALAEDLGISVINITSAYRSLGCSLKFLSERDRASKGLSDTLADTKFAVLGAPVKFPKVRKGKGRGK